MAEKKYFKVDKDNKIVYIFNVEKITDEQWKTIDTYKDRLGYSIEETSKAEFDKKKGKKKVPAVGYRKPELIYYIKKNDSDYLTEFESLNFMKAKSEFDLRYKDYDASKNAADYAKDEMPAAKKEMLKYMKENATAAKYKKFAALADKDFFAAISDYNIFKKAKERKAN